MTVLEGSSDRVDAGLGHGAAARSLGGPPEPGQDALADHAALELGEHDGNATAYTYDGLDRLVQTTYADSTQAAPDYDGYVYDAYGRLSQRRQRDGSTRSYAYDNLGRLLNDGVSYYGYDNVGRLTATSTVATSPVQYNLALSYDALGRKTVETNSYGGAVGVDNLTDQGRGRSRVASPSRVKRP